MKKICLACALLVCGYAASAAGQTAQSQALPDVLPGDCISAGALQTNVIAAQDAIGESKVTLSAYSSGNPIKSGNPQSMPTITCIFNITYPNPEHLPVLARPLFYHSTIKTLVQITLVATRDTNQVVAYQVSVEGPNQSQGLMKKGVYPTAFAKEYVAREEQAADQAKRVAADAQCASPSIRNAAKAAALQFFKVHDVPVTINDATDTMGADLNSPSTCLFAIEVGNMNARDFTAIVNGSEVILSPWTGGTDNGGW